MDPAILILTNLDFICVRGTESDCRGDIECHWRSAVAMEGSECDCSAGQDGPHQSTSPSARGTESYMTHRSNVCSM